MPPRKARSARNSIAALVAALAFVASSAFAADSLDTLVLAYPDTIQARAGNDLILRNGVRLDAGVSDGAMPFDVVLTHASIRDMLRIAYPAGAPLTAPAENFDPGRFRNKVFFDAMYGDCRKGRRPATGRPRWQAQVAETRQEVARRQLPGSTSRPGSPASPIWSPG